MHKSFLFIFAALAFLTSCDNLNKPTEKDQPQEATTDTAVVYRDGKTAADMATNTADATSNAASNAGNAIGNAFDVRKAKLNDLKFEEVNLPDVIVQGNNDYSIYGPIINTLVK